MANIGLKEKFWTFWKGFGLAMLLVNLLLVSYILYKFNVLTGIRDAIGNVDSTIVFSLSILQTVIALGAFAGFWLVRGSAKEAAREAAAECSPECTDKWLTKNIESHLIEYFREDEGKELVSAMVSDHISRNTVTEAPAPSVEELL